jgi:hypothetical protein
MDMIVGHGRASDGLYVKEEFGILEVEGTGRRNSRRRSYARVIKAAPNAAVQRQVRSTSILELLFYKIQFDLVQRPLTPLLNLL